MSRLWPAALSALLLLPACSGEQRGDDGVTIVATTSIVGDIAANVVGDGDTVEVLIPTGSDAHDFVPSARQVAQAARADLAVAIGLGLEEGLADALESVAAAGVEVVELAPLADPLLRDDGRADPHFWMDPVRVAEAATALAEALEERYPGEGWRERAGSYREELEAADAEIMAMLEQVPPESREIVTNHEALGYFAARYQLEVIGVVIPGGSTLGDPSSAEMAALVGLMRERGVNVIFAETTRPTTLAEAVASELGEDVEVVQLFTESLGPPGSDADSLIGMLRANAERITSALR